MPGVIGLGCLSFNFSFIYLFFINLSCSAVMETLALSLCPWSSSQGNVFTVVNCSSVRGVCGGWLTNLGKMNPWRAEGHSRNPEGLGLGCPHSKLFPLSRWRWASVWVTLESALGSGTWSTCPPSPRVQNGPVSCGLYNLGRNIHGRRNPALADGVIHDLIAAFPLESQGACSANPILRPLQRPVGQWW